eukprot:5183452-Pyramimonas_sp.AAC.1
MKSWNIELYIPNNIASLYGSSCANNGKDALNTPSWDILNLRDVPRVDADSVLPLAGPPRECEDPEGAAGSHSLPP